MAKKPNGKGNGSRNGDNHQKKTIERPWLEAHKWKAGDPSPNPAGRPRLKTPSELIREMLQAEFGGYGMESVKQIQQALPEPWRSKPTEKLTNEEILCGMTIIAGRRSIDAVLERETIFNRVEGRPVQKIAGPDGGAIKLEPVYNWKNLSTDELRQLRALQLKAMAKEDEE